MTDPERLIDDAKKQGLCPRCAYPPASDPNCSICKGTLFPGVIDLIRRMALNLDKAVERMDYLANALAVDRERQIAASLPTGFNVDGSLKWESPVNVGHLIEQLKTLDPKMQVGAVSWIKINDKQVARSYGLSMSLEKWDEAGFLNYTIPGTRCLAIWASQFPEDGVPVRLPSLSDSITSTAAAAITKELSNS